LWTLEDKVPTQVRETDEIRRIAVVKY
jgi:hypothetical protein